MKLLLDTGHRSLFKYPDPDGRPVHRNLGRLTGPRQTSRIEDTAAAGIPWAADNDCFNGFRAKPFRRLLDIIRDIPGCLFVTVPDVYQNARATAEYFDRYAPWLEKRGLPVALVLQDGVERELKWLGSVWDRLTAVFIGGSDQHKRGPVVACLVDDALRSGKYVHWGRVSSRMVIRYAIHIGGHSFDSTQFSRFRNQRLLRVLALTLQPAPLARRRIQRAVRLP